MADPLPILAEIDADGALAEASDAFLEPTTRRRLLRSGVAAGASILAGLTGAQLAQGGLAQTKGDIGILRFDLVLEYLQAAFTRRRSD